MKRISGVIAILVSLSGISPAVAGEYGLLNAPVALVAYNYVHFSTFDGFVAALDESREYGSTIKEKAPQTGYRNIHTFESFTAMLVDNYDSGADKNIRKHMETFPSLAESYPNERYQAIMDRSRFTALDGEGCGNVQADLLSNPDWAEAGCI